MLRPLGFTLAILTVLGASGLAQSQSTTVSPTPTATRTPVLTNRFPVPRGPIPQFLVGRWRATVPVGDSLDTVTDEITYQFLELGLYFATTRVIVEEGGREVVLYDGTNRLTRGTYSVSSVSADRFVLTAQPQGFNVAARSAVIERLDANTLRDPGGLILRRVR